MAPPPAFSSESETVPLTGSTFAKKWHKDFGDHRIVDEDEAYNASMFVMKMMLQAYQKSWEEMLKSDERFLKYVSAYIA